jgi:hypothetical protein
MRPSSIRAMLPSLVLGPVAPRAAEDRRVRLQFDPPLGVGWSRVREWDVAEHPEAKSSRPSTSRARSRIHRVPESGLSS